MGLGVPKVRYLTEREIEIMDAIIEKGDYQKASQHLTSQGKAASVNLMRQTTLRIRQRYDNSKMFIELVERYQQALSRKDRKRRYFTG